tara:strand:- start:227 stop:640 length:414 start_codon:yes stop_codon:yes gene_type:complete
MAELFEPTPEPDNSKQPIVVSPETKICRTISALLMIAWFWWWWHSYEDGAYWVIPAVFILATGETRPHYYKFLRPIWVPLSYLIDPIIFLLRRFARITIPETYRRPQKVLKPLSFKEINEALDEAAAKNEKRKEAEK